MPKVNRSEKVPKEMLPRFEELVGLTDAFCAAHLNDEYKKLCRELTAALCRKRLSPVISGKGNTLAAGIIHALGTVNFLFDPSQKPHVKASKIYEYFDIGQSTGQAKSKQIRDLLKMHQFDPNWTLPSKIDKNPLVWRISVNGIIIDARYAPHPIQEEAFRKGIIPYLPEIKD